ncbi:MAG: protein-glutamate O-methyltransferase [Candidatus Polarisedimenticolaceae bacterium]|nr:protein-glutamate O-methyltransferase [Candidatus Polarisedimenticolaceae bacterium]
MSERNREFEFTQRDFDFLRKMSNDRTGIVVSDDKFDMFYSRLSRRVRTLGLRKFSEYCDYLKANPEGDESLEFINSITTNLTAFFRENHHFEYLTKTVIPELVGKNSADRKIRIWSSGCSTGEEPYSIAMTLHDAMSSLAGWDYRIMATDIDSNVLTTASNGIYQMERVNGVDKKLLRRWFQQGKGSNTDKVRAKKELREIISFKQINLMSDWKLRQPRDVIFCRNVIIYFDKETKIRLVDRYAENLKTGGYLFIGHSESLFNITNRFELIGNTIYRKIK